MRPSPPPEVRPLPWREAERIEVGGFPQAPTKEGCALSGLSRRAGSPSRGSGCDMHRVRCFAAHFSQINENLLERCWSATVYSSPPHEVIFSGSIVMAMKSN